MSLEFLQKILKIVFCKNFDFLSGINLIELYQNNQKFKNETEDAKLFIRCTKKFPKGYRYKGETRNTSGWNTVVVAGKIIEKIGPILAINDLQALKNF